MEEEIKRIEEDTPQIRDKLQEVQGKRGLDSINSALDFLEEMAIVLAESIKDGRVTLWDLRLLVKLYQPGKKAFKGLPAIVGETLDLTMPELAMIAIRTIDILKSFAKTLFK